MRGTVAVLALCLAAATACGSVASGPAGSSPSQPAESTPIGATSPTAAAADMNVRGTIDRGPAVTCPSGEPCDPAITAAYVVFSQPGKPDIRVKVDPSGAFALHLDPGAYAISAAPPPQRGKLAPDTIRVPDQGTVTLRLVIS